MTRSTQRRSLRMRHAAHGHALHARTVLPPVAWDCAAAGSSWGDLRLSGP